MLKEFVIRFRIKNQFQIWIHQTSNKKLISDFEIKCKFKETKLDDWLDHVITENNN